MKVVVLDGYNLMHRARFGMNRGNEHIVFNFFRSLRPIVEALNPDVLYFVLEGVPKHRLILDAEYKGNRAIEEGTAKWDEMEEFRRQKKIIVETMTNMPIRIIKHPDYECDDAIASICVDVHKNDDCTIVSTDTDFIQLLANDERIKIYNPITKLYVEKPDYDYLVWKSLRGDKTDNVMPVTGISDKKAEKLVKDPALLSKLLENKNLLQQYERNYSLIAFRTGIQGGFEYLHNEVSWDAVRAQFSKLFFNSITNDKSWDKYVTTFDNVKV